MSEEQNKELVRRAIAAEDRDDHDEMLEFVGPEWEDQALWHAPHHLTDTEAPLRERFQQALDQQNRVFAQPPQTTIDEMIAAGDRVITCGDCARDPSLRHAAHLAAASTASRTARLSRRIPCGTAWASEQLGAVPQTADLMARSAAM